MCFTSLLCGPRVDLWPFYGFLCKRFSLYIKVYPHSVLSPSRVSPFLAWGDFHARLRFARSTIPEEKWGTTRSLLELGVEPGL